MRIRILLLTVAVVLCSRRLLADDTHHHFDPNVKLGKVSFPTSCAISVQEPFEHGVALLHSFWYEEADKQFRQVADVDPACAMAYWGQAMSLYHPLWNPPRPVGQGARMEPRRESAGDWYQDGARTRLHRLYRHLL